MEDVHRDGVTVDTMQGYIKCKVDMDVKRVRMTTTRCNMSSPWI